MSKPRASSFTVGSLWPKDNEVFVTKQVRRLPIQLRQQQLQLWSRSNAINSDRERERAKVIGDANEAAATRPARLGRVTEDDAPEEAFKAASSPRKHLIVPQGANGLGSPRSRYMDLVGAHVDSGGESRRQSGFAYGGVFPGKRDVRGPAVENHEVRFSIGVTGSYLLYVSLRKPHTPWESGSGTGIDDWQVKGSPFVITVVPGKAYPLSTTLTVKTNDQLRGFLESGEPARYSFEHLLQACDKMGNLCDSGAAEVTCGFLRPSASSAPSARPTGAGANTPAPEETRSQADAQSDTKQTATCTDVENGTYKLKWNSLVPGVFTVYVKIDGLHVIGSPARILFAKADAKTARDKVDPKAVGKS